MCHVGFGDVYVDAYRDVVHFAVSHKDFCLNRELFCGDLLTHIILPLSVKNPLPVFFSIGHHLRPSVIFANKSYFKEHNAIWSSKTSAKLYIFHLEWSATRMGNVSLQGFLEENLSVRRLSASIILKCTFPEMVSTWREFMTQFKQDRKSICLSPLTTCHEGYRRGMDFNSVRVKDW